MERASLARGTGPIETVEIGWYRGSTLSTGFHSLRPYTLAVRASGFGR